MDQNNPLKQMYECGTSVWLDFISRKLIDSGELKKLINEDGISGLTSNPTIFQKAIAGSPDYDESIKKLIKDGLTDDEIYESLVIKDIQDCADIFRPIYDKTEGRDGFVSLEVSPLLAYDTEKTIEEGKKLWTLVNRKNLLVKVPATKEGLPAIEALIAEGININVTLIFSVKRYREVTQAYIHGLNKRLSENKSVSEIASVASFFVSRLDGVVDKLLEDKISKATDEDKKKFFENLLYKSAVANGKVAYNMFEEIFQGADFKGLKEKGAGVQRVLWASTSTKNPDLSDVLYVEPLIGPASVNTMPPATIEAARDHAKVKISIRDHVEEAKKHFEELDLSMIDYDE
ncbi:transaldolase, partial [PVC group bacterium]|nr:transaldolase [PVC group bacterium]